MFVSQHRAFSSDALRFGFALLRPTRNTSDRARRSRSGTGTKARKYTHYFPINQGKTLVFGEFQPSAGIRTMLAHTTAANIRSARIPPDKAAPTRSGRTLHRTTCVVPMSRSSRRSSAASPAARTAPRPSAWPPSARRTSGLSPDPGFRNLMPDLSTRPTCREVTACGGTFPDTATCLHGFGTLIGLSSSGDKRQRRIRRHRLDTAGYSPSEAETFRRRVRTARRSANRTAERPHLRPKTISADARGAPAENTTSWPS